MAEFKIAYRWIGDEHTPVVIAEIGINHEGSIETAIAMADAAIDAAQRSSSTRRTSSRTKCPMKRSW